MCWCKPYECHSDILVSVINKHNQNYDRRSEERGSQESKT